MDNRKDPIIVEQYFDLPLTQVWKAITEHDQMIQWFFSEIPAFKPEIGFRTSFDIESGGRNFHHLWKIIEVTAPYRIVYHWSYSNIEGEGIVIFELFDKGDKTLLCLRNEGLDSFPADIPEFSREAAIGGWEYFINGELKNYLDNR